MTAEVLIQGATHSFRDAVAKWNEKKVRTEAAKRDIPGAETVDLTTLREAIVQDWRDDQREAERLAPKVPLSRDSELELRRTRRAR